MTPCLEYRGHRTEKGYGRINRRVGGGLGRGKGRIVSTYVHRLVWERVNGPIPEGLETLHLCDNPPCFRLDHLKLGTHAENLADMRRKRRDRPSNRGKTHCRHGHEYTPENTYVRAGSGYRECKTCQRDRERRKQ